MRSKVGVWSACDPLDGATALRSATGDADHPLSLAAGMQCPLLGNARMMASFTGQLVTWSIVLIVVAAIALGLLYVALDWWENNNWW